MLGIDARSSRELQAVILGLKLADKEVQSQIREQARRVMVPEWQQGLTERAITRPEVRLAGTGRAKVSNQTVVLQAGGVRGSATADMRILNRAVEFGADRSRTSTYRRRSKKGRSHSVTRHTRNQFRPIRSKGYVAYPTASDLIPRLASLWVQTVVRVFHEAFEGRRG